MQSLEEIKLRLHSLIKKKIDGATVQTMRFYEQDGHCHFIMTNQHAPEKPLHGVSSDGFTFTLIPFPHEQKLFLGELEGLIPLVSSDQTIRFGYCGDRHIHLAFQNGTKEWICDSKILIHSSRPTQAAGAWKFPGGNLLLYYEKQTVHGIPQYSAHLALFDSEHPDELLWHTSDPLWKSKDQWGYQVVEPLGSVFLNETIVMYWRVNEQVLYGVHLSGVPFDPSRFSRPQLRIDRHASNPMIAPHKHHPWESFTTLNPAAFYADKAVHILYRAQGYDYISSVGYARSKNGYSIEKRHHKPVFAPHQDFEINNTGHASSEYMSAGGYGGCEDPRVTLIDDTLYMIYVAFDGWTPPRLAMTSILLDDFLKERWNWAKPVLISPPGVVDKSGCLLSEKIRGQYVLFHRIFPDILIDYVDNLAFDGKSTFLKGQYRISPRPTGWDSRKIGAGAPPIKTKDGWLLIYYGVDDKDASKYHIGAMLLDLKRPEKVLYRTDKPILSPTAQYEMSGFKPGIAYPCGAVVVQGKLLVYYGGADMYVCVAEADLDVFLNDMKADRTPLLHSIRVNELTI